MPKTYETSCTGYNGLLDGFIELDEATHKVISYKSSQVIKPGTVTDKGGSLNKLKFKVAFDGHADPFEIEANRNGKGKWKGKAKDRALIEEPWTATATTLMDTEGGVMNL